jgi:hypothetical protein
MAADMSGDQLSPQTSRSILHHMGLVSECPSCGGSDFLIEEHLGQVVFQCLGCAGEWHYALGYLWQVGS